MSELLGVGYWIEDEVLGYNEEARALHAAELELPDPARLLETLGPAEANPRVLQYLRSGHEFMALLGYSYCRFRCGIPDAQMGSRDLTDGVWMWPEGLAHYVEVHQVPLPEEFLATMARNAWSVPAALDPITLAEAGCDLSAWKTWYAARVPGAPGKR